MEPVTKIMIKTFLLSGLVFAGLMAGFDHYDGKEFIVLKFIFNVAFFGLLMALMARHNYKKQIKETENPIK
jgi:ABC-type uncharacterized transport system permease subunit